MRRSKSDPAKYARKYRQISQRRMTAYDHVNEEEEIERLQSLLKHSQAQTADDGAAQQHHTHQKRDRSSSPLDDNPSSSLLSDDLVAELGGNQDAENPIYLLGSKKKKPKTAPTPTVTLSPHELKQAKQLQKKTERKLVQLEKRKAQKEKRTHLYQQLQSTALMSHELPLLHSSATLGKKRTKKEQLKLLLQKERAGIQLSHEEHHLLYNEKTVVSEERPTEGDWEGNTTRGPPDPVTVKEFNKEARTKTLSSPPSIPRASRLSTEQVDSGPTASNKVSFASQMMASLSNLKVESAAQAEIVAEDRRKEEGRIVKEKEAAVNASTKKPYVPPEPIVLKSAAAMGLTPKPLTATIKVIQINRPEDIKVSRYELPVCGMEFEIMDAIRNNDVTIVCGDTGSGKSTQVPQFLYEMGMTQVSVQGGASFMVGVTQPRRVAAVSTAKRVCYELGLGNGRTIPNSSCGCLVSYQTRYETAGLGTNTHIKFMTDGILLQEIQSDLLLRKYSVIVLDEAHERNLNTDVLIGLLSMAMPLRKQATLEDKSLVPLKLVIMSATLRVSDFTENTRLFPKSPPVVVTVPGRTHPVVIHHSKVTELVKYEDAAFEKICKIHQKLPAGGILVFLTGKHEITRMVARLRKALGGDSGRMSRASELHFEPDMDTENVRELDDEELDADNYLLDEIDDDVEKQEHEIAQVPAEPGLPREAYILPLYSLLSSDDQAKVFEDVPEGHRLIVVATNIAETSITIPGIAYVVDTGRQKCRNYSIDTGISSYDVSWISKASADQRAGRAGRTGPGHCYRLYSSALYSKLDAFALPEVRIRPLEDVVLSMKAMKISHVAEFPFPTPPERVQLEAATLILANLGCVDASNVEKEGGDGEITRLGAAVAKLPIGVRYSKMILVAAQAGVLDYAIAMISALSEPSLFRTSADGDHELTEGMDEDDANNTQEAGTDTRTSNAVKKWFHRSGDVLAAATAVGAYAYAGRGAGGESEKLACRRFCEENGLDFPVMQRIQKMRKQLARLLGSRLCHVDSVAAKTRGFLSSMPPPDKLQERLLCQAITSGLLDHVVMLAPLGSITGEYSYSLRTAYLSCSTSLREPLFLDRNSVLYSQDPRQLPKWICFDSLVRKSLKDGTPIAIMKRATPVDPTWLGHIAAKSRLLKVGDPLPSPPPTYEEEQDSVLCSVETRFGEYQWEIPPIKVEMYTAIENLSKVHTGSFSPEDSFRWFARFLLEGRVIAGLKDLETTLNDRPSLLTRRSPMKKVVLLVSALSNEGIDTAAALVEHWATKDDKFLFKYLKAWVAVEREDDAKRIWITAVRESVQMFEKGRSPP